MAQRPTLAQDGGVLLESSVHGSGDGYLNTVVASVRYSYRVNGQEYESDRVHYAGFGTQIEALTTRDAYPPGMPVTVFFDPARPSRAVLEHDPPLFPYLLLPIGLAILAYVVLQAWDLKVDCKVSPPTRRNSTL